MKVKIPCELIMKFVTFEGLILNSTFELNSDMEIDEIESPIICLDLSKNSKCFNACMEWYLILNTYYKTSQRAYRFDIGPYKGLYPISLDCNGRVEFTFEDVDLDKKDWKEWFIKEDFVYEPNQNSTRL